MINLDNAQFSDEHELWSVTDYIDTCSGDGNGAYAIVSTLSKIEGKYIHVCKVVDQIASDGNPYLMCIGRFDTKLEALSFIVKTEKTKRKNR